MDPNEITPEPRPEHQAPKPRPWLAALFVIAIAGLAVGAGLWAYRAVRALTVMPDSAPQAAGETPAPDAGEDEDEEPVPLGTPDVDASDPYLRERASRV